MMIISIINFWKEKGGVPSPSHFKTEPVNSHQMFFRQNLQVTFATETYSIWIGNLNKIFPQ